MADKPSEPKHLCKRCTALLEHRGAKCHLCGYKPPPLWVQRINTTRRRADIP